MEPITMAIGMAISAAGLFGSNKAKKKEEKVNRQINREQQRMSRIESEASMKQEALRRQSMEMDALQSRRQILRNQQIARAEAITTGTGQGVNLGSSSIQGALAQVQGTGDEEAMTLAGNLQMGRSMFDINQGLFEQQAASNQRLSRLGASAASARSNANMWGGVTSIGNSIFSNAEPIGRSFDTLYGRKTSNR